jgi:hypothetical protein
MLLLSTYLPASINLSTYLPAYEFVSVYPPINSPTYLPTCLSICLPTTYLLTHPPTYLPTNLPACQFVCLPTTYLHTYLPTYLPTQKPTYLTTDLPTHPPTYLSIYGSANLKDLGHFFSFLTYTQSVGLLGRGISPSQGRYLLIE